jgi:hypothetical protein
MPAYWKKKDIYKSAGLGFGVGLFKMADGGRFQKV